VSSTGDRVEHVEQQEQCAVDVRQGTTTALGSSLWLTMAPTRGKRACTVSPSPPVSVVHTTECALSIAASTSRSNASALHSDGTLAELAVLPPVMLLSLLVLLLFSLVVVVELLMLV
jgi:hypothetical protein